MADLEKNFGFKERKNHGRTCVLHTRYPRNHGIAVQLSLGVEKMIRVFSADYEKNDYRLLMFALSAGLNEMKKSASCSGYCDSCYCGRVCRSLQSAVNYVDKKSKP